LAAGLDEPLHQPRHVLPEMLRQRRYGILANCEGCNGHGRLRDNPIFKILADRLTETPQIRRPPCHAWFPLRCDLGRS